MRQLLHFPHGVGDCVQFTIVLKHLRAYYPDTFIAIVTEPGRENIFQGLVDQYSPSIHPHWWKSEKWDEVIDVAFRRPTQNYVGWANTKVTESLIYDVGLRPIPALYRYEIRPTPEAEQTAQSFADKIGTYVFCHFVSETSGEDKRLNEEEIDVVIEKIQSQGLMPVVLDFERRIKRRHGVVFLDPNSGLFDRWGDAQIIRSVIARAKAFIGIDSGPAHLAAATETPSIVIWRGTVAPYCFDPAPNCFHLVPDDMPRTMHGEDREEALAFFKDNYRSETYENLREHLQALPLNTFVL